MLESALAYPIVGPWRASLVKLGLNTAVIEAEIIAGGAATAAAIVERHIDKRSQIERKQVNAITRTLMSDASCITAERGMTRCAQRQDACHLRQQLNHANDDA